VEYPLIQRRFGTHRTTYVFGKYAIKLPVFVEWRLFLHGLLANMQERKFSAMGWPELCPVVFSVPGGWFLVMRRADPLPREQWEHFNYEVWIDRGDYCVPVENKLDSFGLINQHIVAVDYG
jgi:hypothetical protein